MKKEHRVILDLISDYLEKHPDQRFGQAFFNLRINEFQEKIDPATPNYNLRDIYNDDDADIIERIKNQIEWFDLQEKVRNGISNIDGIKSMTVNERLYLTDLSDIFDKYKATNKEYARFILESIDVDFKSIEIILEEN